MPRPVLESLLERAAAAAPREACGFVTGRVTPAGVLVLRATLARNLANGPHQFETHPEDQLAAERDAAAAGELVLGAWHSHVRGAAAPSARDLANSAYPLAWIVSLEERAVRCWVGPREVALARDA